MVFSTESPHEAGFLVGASLDVPYSTFEKALVMRQREMHDEVSQTEKYGERVLLTVRDVAHVLQISLASVYAIVAEGKIACHRVGTGRGSIRFEEHDLNEYLSSCRMEKAEETKRPPRPRLKHLKL